MRFDLDEDDPDNDPDDDDDFDEEAEEDDEEGEEDDSDVETWQVGACDMLPLKVSLSLTSRFDLLD